ncbi:MAG: hypothetical protein K9I71_12600 [Ignavibacteriales bacterium]|nr:hypothetical protein [Ignavibacteriales bacterium]MCF8437772.1 hypothetical protein [Ignavibacteriales bacterium]
MVKSILLYYNTLVVFTLEVRSDLMDGIKIADKENFFSFTNGRILTIDY